MIHILMKNGWPVSAFTLSWEAENNLDAAKENDPNNHWMILELKVWEATNADDE